MSRLSHPQRHCLSLLSTTEWRRQIDVNCDTRTLLTLAERGYVELKRELELSPDIFYRKVKALPKAQE